MISTINIAEALLQYHFQIHGQALPYFHTLCHLSVDGHFLSTVIIHKIKNNKY